MYLTVHANRGIKPIVFAHRRPPMSPAIILRRYIARNAADGSAMLMPRTKSGIRVCCRCLKKRAARIGLVGPMPGEPDIRAFAPNTIKKESHHNNIDDEHQNFKRSWMAIDFVNLHRDE